MPLKKLKKPLAVLASLGVVLTSLYSCTGNRPTTQLGEIRNIAMMVVPNQDQVRVLDTSTNRVLTTLETDGRPESIAASPDRRIILVTNTNSGTVSVFLRRDNIDYQKLGSVGNGSNPIGIAFNPVQQEAYVAYQGDGKVLVLDTRNRSAAPVVSATIALPNGARPGEIAVSSDGNRVFVTDIENDRVLTLVRTSPQNFSINPSQPLSQNSNPASVELGGMVIDNQNRLFITNTNGSNVFVFDGNSGRVLQSISLQDAQVVGQRQVGPRNLALYPPSSNTGVVPGQPVGVPQQPTAAQRVYVTGFSASVISVIDAQGLRLLGNIPLTVGTTQDANNPVGIAVGTAAGGADRVFVTNSGGRNISLIDPNQGQFGILLRNISDVANFGAQDPLGEMITIGAVR